MYKRWQCLFGCLIIGLAMMMPTTLSASSSTSLSPALKYAASLLETVALPPGARTAAKLSVPLHPVAGPGEFGGVDYRRNFEVPANVNLLAFLNMHRPPGSAPWSTGSTGDPGFQVTTYTTNLRCSNRHVPTCGIGFTVATPSSATVQELRVDVYLSWEPIVTEWMPVTGAVTVTGYRHLSLMNSSSGPSSVKLTTRQARVLREKVAALKVAGSGICAEDSQLLTITVTSGSSRTVTWQATVDECPGLLRVAIPATATAFDARTCDFANFVAGLFPPGEAKQTVKTLRACL